LIGLTSAVIVDEAQKDIVAMPSHTFPASLAYLEPGSLALARG